MPHSDFSVFFGEWGFPWKSCAFTSTELSYNTAVNALFKDDSRLPPSLPPLPGKYLTGVELGHAVYLTKVDETAQEPNVSPATPGASPIVHTRIGKGYMGYVGFANGEEKVIDIVLAMLRL